MKRKHIFLIWCMALSALFIGLASKSSPLYPLNDWVDVNCFFTMGRSLLDGLVPYRDLYEQKGPVLYFAFAIIALFSRHSYVGVYVAEVITYGLFLYFSGKIAGLYLGKTRWQYTLVAIIGALVPMSWSFTHGGSVEQHCLFMICYGLYTVLAAIKEKRPLTRREAVLNGVWAGMMLWIKYTMLGFYLGLALAILIRYLCDRDLRHGLFRVIGQFFLGIALVSAVVFAYFAWHGALKDLWTVYFYNNIFLYPAEVEGSRWISICACLGSAIRYNRCYSWMLLGGIAWLAVQLFINWKAALTLILSFAGLTVGTYWGCRGYDYYGLIFAAYVVFGLLLPVQLLRLIQGEKALKLADISPVVFPCAMVLLVAVLFSFAMKEDQNLYMTRYNKDDTPQYQFAQIINTVENPTLLNYGFLDGGFYYAADATPACRFYCYFNIDAPDMWHTQRQCIENGDADFIVTRKYPLNRYNVDSSGYTLVAEATFPFSANLEFTYYLYQKNGT